MLSLPTKGRSCGPDRYRDEGNLSVRTAEQLIEQGIEIPDDVTELARLLDATDEELAAAKSTTAETSTATDAADKAAAAAAAEAETKAAKEANDAAAAAATAAAAKPAAAAAAEVPDEETGPPRALLRGYRETIHQRDRDLEASETQRREALDRAAAAERELELLKTKVTGGQEQLQAKADEIATGVDLTALTPEKIAELRKTHDDDVVNIIEGLAKATETLQEQLDNISADNKRLTESREATEQQAFLDDIDSVPLLGVLRLSTDPKFDALWERSNAYLKAVKADPDFASKPRTEVFGEVARRMEGFMGKDAVKALLGDKPAAAAPAGAKPAVQTPAQILDEALKRAEKATVPTSLSEIPAAGSAAAQDTLGRVEAMSQSDMAELFDRQLAAGKSVDELLAKLTVAI